jgi:hypothetical protein
VSIFPQFCSCESQSFCILFLIRGRGGSAPTPTPLGWSLVFACQPCSFLAPAHEDQSVYCTRKPILLRELTVRIISLSLNPAGPTGGDAVRYSDQMGVGSVRVHNPAGGVSATADGAGEWHRWDGIKEPRQPPRRGRHCHVGQSQRPLGMGKYQYPRQRTTITPPQLHHLYCTISITLPLVHHLFLYHRCCTIFFIFFHRYRITSSLVFSPLRLSPIDLFRFRFFLDSIQFGSIRFLTNVFWTCAFVVPCTLHFHLFALHASLPFVCLTRFTSICLPYTLHFHLFAMEASLPLNWHGSFSSLDLP